MRVLIYVLAFGFYSSLGIMAAGIFLHLPSLTHAGLIVLFSTPIAFVFVLCVIEFMAGRVQKALVAFLLFLILLVNLIFQ